MYQTYVILVERRDPGMMRSMVFPSAESREEYVKGPEVYWYHYAEEDDWTLWRRGGAWKATQEPGPADRINEPPEITDDDRW